MTAKGKTKSHDESEAFGIAPQFDHLLVRQPEHGDKMRDGLWLPTIGRDKNEAEVLAVGPGRYHEGALRPCSFKVGDRVVLANATYHPISVDGHNLLLVKEQLVVAKVTNKDSILLNSTGKKNYALEYEGASE